MHRKANILSIAVFCGFIGAFFVINLFTPDRTFSEDENRYLAARPQLSAESLFQGDFTADYETYVTDQFVWRDGFIAVKAAAERASGKQENNGVYFGKDGFLTERFDAPDASRVEKNVASVLRFCQNTDIPVYFTLIPNSSYIWREKLPENAPGADQGALIDEIRASLGSEVHFIDTLSALQAHKDEAIYYNTDHHWTTLGAFYGYSAVCGAMGLDEKDQAGYEDDITALSGFYGTAYSRSGVRWVAPDTVEIWVPEEKIGSVTYYTDGTPQEGSYYDMSFAERKDKYSAFMSGNQPLVVIRTGAEGGRKLLYVKDSFANCEIPFFTADFSEIHVVDLRFYKAKLSDYAAENGITDALISYSVANFTSDTGLAFLG